MEFNPEEKYVNIEGRTLSVNGVRYLSYSGSSISFTFTGKKAQALIESDSPDWEESLKGWIAVYINEERDPIRRICLDNKMQTYLLYESEQEKRVTLHIVKYSEAAFGSCGIHSLYIDTDKLEKVKDTRKRKIEIIGDSITCGYGVEATDAMQPFDTVYENPTKSYSMRTIKTLGAKGHLVSWSGIGIISNFVDENATAPLDTWLMPMLYKYTDAGMSSRLFGENRDKWESWDFSGFKPDIIVINIGTNDASYCKDIQERKEIFEVNYEKFVDYVAENNPTSQLLCVLGTMEQRLCENVKRVVEKEKKKGLEGRIHFLHLPLQNEADGYGADSHPSDVTQEKTSEIVVDKIKEIMNWT